MKHPFPRLQHRTALAFSQYLQLVHARPEDSLRRIVGGEIDLDAPPEHLQLVGIFAALHFREDAVNWN